MKSRSTYLLFVFLQIFLHLQVWSQQSVSYTAQGKNLDVVLNELSDLYKIRFAFEAETFHEVKADFDMQNVSFNEFLQMLEEKYFISSKNIGGTWVLVKKEPVLIAVEKKKDLYSEVSGYITDRYTGEKLLYCNVLVGSQRGGMTNEMGYFNIAVPAADSVRIQVSHLAYSAIDTVVATGKTIQLKLVPHEIMMEAIQVKNYEKQVLQASGDAGKIAFNPNKASSFPRVATDDLANALLVIPGINFIQGSMSGLSVRGNLPSDNLVLLDGIPVLETSHLLGNMSVLNSKFVHQTFVSRGGFDVEHGGRVAGLIQVIGKSGKSDHEYIDISANMLNANMLVNLPVTPKLSFTAAWRRSFIDKWQNYMYSRITDVSSASNAEFSSINPYIKYQDLNTKISFHPSDRFEINLNLLYGSDNQSRDFTLFTSESFYRNESTESENIGFGLNMNWQSSNYLSHKLSAGYSSFDKSVVDETGELEEVTEVVENPSQGKGKGKGLLKTREKTFERLVSDIDNGINSIEEIRASWKTTHQKGAFTHTAGMEWIADEFEYRFLTASPGEAITLDSINNRGSLYLLNGYLQQEIDLWNRAGFKWGIRANMDLSSGTTYWQPRGSFNLHVIPGLDFYYQSGVYYQFLSGARRFDSGNRYSYLWNLAVEDQNMVSSYHHVAGSRFEKKGWYIDLEGYYKTTSGRLNLFATGIESGNGTIVVYQPESGREKTMGIDFFLQKKVGIFNQMVSYSWSQTRERITNRFDDQWFPGFNDRTHQLKLVEMISWKHWILTGSMHFATGLPVIDLNSSNQISNIYRTDYYSQFDLVLAKNWFLPHATLQAGISLLNLADRQNIVEVSYLKFSTAQETLTIRSDASALGFTPLFFLNLKIH